MPPDVLAVAPLIEEQLPPSVCRNGATDTHTRSSGRRSQVPLLAVRVLFSEGVPEIVGGCAFFGAPALAVTTLVALELKLAVPSGSWRSPGSQSVE
jgi:hypothetical protein